MSLPTVVPAARALYRSVTAHVHVPKFARGSVFPAVNRAIYHDSRAYALRYKHRYEVMRPPDLKFAKPKFGNGDRIRVVVYCSGNDVALVICCPISQFVH